MKSVRLWCKAVRPYAFSASIVPVAIGGMTARQSGVEFSGVRFGMALAAGVLLHTAANLWNDFFDFHHGVDRAGGGVGSGVLVAGEMTPNQCLCGATVCAWLAALLGIGLAWQVGWGILILGMAGMLGALVYSAGPSSPKQNAMGEVWLFLLMGLGLPLGGFVAQTGKFAWQPLLISSPAALLMVLILYANNLRDVASDRAAGIRTLPMRLSPRAAKGVAHLLLGAPYFLTGLLLASSLLPIKSSIVFWTLPLAIRWAWSMESSPVTESHVKWMAGIHLAFGVLFIVSLI